MKRSELLIGFLLGFATFLILSILSSDMAAHYEICETTKEGAKECTRHNVVSFAFREVGIFLDSYNGLITAVATAFIAWFTYSLRQSTDGLKESGEKQIRSMRAIAIRQDIRTQEAIEVSNHSAKVAERALTELEAPFVSIEIAEVGITQDSLAQTRHQFHNLRFVIANYGRTPARIIEVVDKPGFIGILEGLPPIMNPHAATRNSVPYGVIAPPNGKSEGWSHNLYSFTLKDIVEGRDPFNTNYMFFYGFVRYSTIFDEVFRTGFCFMFDVSSQRWIRTGGNSHNYCEREINPPNPLL